jgi:MFS transporter, ACS family, glucarate transporter
MTVPLRSLIVGATFLLAVLLYVDRICISVAKSYISTDLELSDTQMGWVFAAFSLGYALFQTPSGWLADRWGPRRVLSLIVMVWSLFTGLTAVASSYLSMLLVRFLFGAGEAGAFPGVARAMVSWIPMKERGLVQGINFSGSRVGAAFAYPVLALMLAEIGWRSTFVVLMVIGFGWAIAWFLCFRDDPTQTRWLPERERGFIKQHLQSNAIPSSSSESTTSQSISWKSVFRSPTVWALCGQYFASNFTFFFCLTWLFPQLKERYALTGLEASLYASVPLLCGAFGNWFAGWWVDNLYKRNRWRVSRRLPAIVGFALSAIGLVGSVSADSALSSSIWFSLSVFGADMTLAPSWSTCMDIGRDHAGTISGTMNMAGNIGSFVTALAFPSMIAWTGSSTPYFYLAALLNVVSIGLWMAVEPTKALCEASPS